MLLCVLSLGVIFPTFAAEDASRVTSESASSSSASATQSSSDHSALPETPSSGSAGEGKGTAEAQRKDENSTGSSKSESEPETASDFPLRNEAGTPVHKEGTPGQFEWKQEDQKWYCYSEGTRLDGDSWVEMSDGRRYYLLETDECAVGWYRVDGTWYYFANSVQPKYGWQQIEGKWYYFDESTGEQVHGPRWLEMSCGGRY